MPRVKNNVARLKRKRKILAQAKGYFGRRKNLYKTAKEAVERAWRYAYRDRKNRKRDFRRLWIIRINAAARQHDMSYSRFMNGLKLAGVEVNRKVLADLAVTDPAAFAQLAEAARSQLNRDGTDAYQGELVSAGAQQAG
jgi:large subunit ribosomal protein L20